MDTKYVKNCIIDDRRFFEEFMEKIVWENLMYLQREIETEFEEEEWIKIDNYPLYYNTKVRKIIVDSNRLRCSREGYSKPINVPCNFRPMTLNEALCIFGDIEKCPLIMNDVIINNEDDYEGNCRSLVGVFDNGVEKAINVIDGTLYNWHFGDKDSIKIPIADVTGNIVSFFLLHKLRINELEQISEKYNYLLDWKKKGYISVSESNKKYDVKYTIKLIEAIKQGSVKDVLELPFSMDSIRNVYEEQMKEKIFSIGMDKIITQLLECDYERAEITKYDEKLLMEPEQGHWDLWCEEDAEDTIGLDYELVARNPISSIRRDGIIAIDFGTKSTVVVRQDGEENSIPMQIGNGEIRKKLEGKDFENPTVLEFVNYAKFWEDYVAKKGRPYTKWRDVTVSHKAANQLKAETNSNNYLSFVHDIKKWAGDEGHQLIIADKNGNVQTLPHYLDISEGEFDPIEIYAYYLGLFINNMWNGIYMKYILSFPVTYKLEVRRKLLSSFSRGLKKSLPEAVLNDAVVMKQFKVMQGASEPAAYAICALQQEKYKDQDNAFYGVFDFGGGTTDFDYGIWRKPNEKEADRYENVIEHFGAGGDTFLGGENLLELLSYHVFLDNIETMRASKLPFSRPSEERENLNGSGLINNKSQSARMNTKIVMEKLRPLWEGSNGSRESNQEKQQNDQIEKRSVDTEDTTVEQPSENNKNECEIKVNLFDVEGDLKPGVTLKYRKDELLLIIRERITQGVNMFFDKLVENVLFRKEKIKKAKRMTIFLAGNSCKSPIVEEVFEEVIHRIIKSLQEKEEFKDISDDYFEIVAPLGFDKKVTADCLL